MNMKALLFYLSIFINKKERKSDASFIMKSFATKIINRNINGFIKRVKKDEWTPLMACIVNNTAFYNPIFFNDGDAHINKSRFDDVFIMSLIKLVFD